MQNKANFSKPKMVVTAVYTMTNNNEQRTTNYSKQTQSNPIYGERSRTTCGELAYPEQAYPERSRGSRSAESTCGEQACLERSRKGRTKSRCRWGFSERDLSVDIVFV
jgi:hypothetical protein